MEYQQKKYQPKVSIQARKQYLEYLTDASFQGVNRLFVLSFENNAHQTRPTAEIRNYNTKID